MTDRARRLEAPHRRVQSGSRLFERGVALGYRAVSWFITRLPPEIPISIIARGAQLSYFLWPSKRRWSNANFGHVLGLPPFDPRVRRTALRAYAAYARYVVELIRLPRVDPAVAGQLVPDADLDGLHELWETSGRGLIFSVGHVGNPEAVGAGIASRGWPISVVADDSGFPELFEEFSRTRERWGIHMIPWRNLREIYSVLRRREMLALAIDWGYRDNGIPVRLFDAWTTMPSGPAVLAAKTGSLIVPVTIRRNPDQRTFQATWASPIEVASTDPAELQRATQLMADALEAAIAIAPEQWYSFKPIWPADRRESEALAARAAEMLQAPGGSVAGSVPEPA